MEIWDILDENGNKTGKIVERGKPMRQDEYHLVVHVWIKNSKGEYLISRRTPNKTFPNMWETTGGAAVVGEDSIQAALREVKEEIGIELSPCNGECVYRFKRQHHNLPDFVDIWLFKQDVDIQSIIYQEDEVCDAKWAIPDEILSMIKEGEFVDMFHYIYDLFERE